jgi:hypothetical protein
MRTSIYGRLIMLAATADMRRRATDKLPRRAPATELMAPPAEGSVQLPDGSIWSHAAELGVFSRGGESIDLSAATLEQIVANFRTGYPQKVPVDYDHGSTNGTSDGSKPVPKAGDVLEMRAVTLAEQLPAEALAVIKAAGREATDPHNLGLWIRWRPTQRALGLIQAREYTEMSITLFSNYQSKTTGDDQGATIVAIALTNLPFLDGMIPVAASRGDDPSLQEDDDMSQSRILIALSALLGKPINTDDEATVALESRMTQLQSEVQELGGLRDFRSAVLAETGAADPAKAIAAIAQLKVTSKSAADGAAAAKATAIAAQVEGVMTKHEKKLTVPSKKLFANSLRVELESGAKLGETETEKALASMQDGPGAGTRASAGDNGEQDAPASQDERIAARAEAIVREDPELAQLAKTDKAEALSRAIGKAGKELGYKPPVYR